MKRLTVHVSGAVKDTVEVKTKNGIVAKTRTLNTLSYPNVDPEEVPAILKQIEDEGKGIPTKHYLSNQKISGLAHGKRKK